MAKHNENTPDSLSGKLGRLFLSPIPIEDLRELIREVFREMLPAIKTNAKWEDEKVMDNFELSKEFNISIPTIWKMNSASELRKFFVNMESIARSMSFYRETESHLEF